MQQDNSKLSTDCGSKLYCEVHPENELQILYFGEQSKRKSRMLCVKCLIESDNKKEHLCQFVYLNDVIYYLGQFLIDSKNSILKIINIDKNDGQKNISIILDDMDKLMLSLEEKFKNQLFKIKEGVQQMRKQVKQIVEELSNELKLNDIVKQKQLLKQMDSYQGTSELTNLENQLNFISENLNNIYQNLNKKEADASFIKFLYNQLMTENSLIDNLLMIKNDIDSTSKKCMDYSAIVYYYGEPIDIKDFPQIHQQISDGKKIEYQLLYSSARDGLNCQAYWTKCNMQQNLLTIMTSKNGNRFGRYSPCQINQSLSNHVQDPTMKSFIFQYNKKEIYKLKTKEYAVYCRSDFGPIYGQADIQVTFDFQNGCSDYLGSSYDISSYNIVDKANHIFGDKTPQLQDIKVYKVIFI